MKLNVESKIIVLITIGIFFTFSTKINNNFNFNARINKKSSECVDDIKSDNENLKISKVSGKIHIFNNWSDAKTAGICTGSGTNSDPYVIEDLEIDTGGSGSGIWIENSIVYFKIENCTIYNSGHGDQNAGIVLNNTCNGLLLNNNCSSNNGYGINLYNKCNNNVIMGNIANYNVFDGLNLETNCYDNEIIGNIANYNGECGIHLFIDCNNNMILENNCNNNGKLGNSGILVSLCCNNDISGNTVTNSNYGIWVFNSKNSDISGNTANNNNVGIGLSTIYTAYDYFKLDYHSVHNIVSGNTVYNNSAYGISLKYSDSNTIMANNVNDNGWAGITLFESESNDITRNLVNNHNEFGIGFHENSNRNTISENLLNGNKICFREVDSEENVFENNDCGDVDTEPGIPGYNLFFLLGTLSVVSILISKKMKKS